MWLFTYGLLCWKFNFNYYEKRISHINGYARKLWQGNNYQRGNKNKLGRVFTIVQSKKSKVFGVTYKIDKSTLLEVNKLELPFGYELKKVFVPEISNYALLYIALPKNEFWLGKELPCKIAKDISSKKGVNGSNMEYVVNLYNFLIKYNITLQYDDELVNVIKCLKEMNKFAYNINNDISNNFLDNFINNAK